MLDYLLTRTRQDAQYLQCLIGHHESLLAALFAAQVLTHQVLRQAGLSQAIAVAGGITHVASRRSVLHCFPKMRDGSCA